MDGVSEREMEKPPRSADKSGEEVQGDYVGYYTGNGEKLNYSQAAGLAWLCLAVA